MALDHRDDAIAAFRRVGPTTFRLVEEVGEHAPAPIKLTARGGDEAVWFVSRPHAPDLFVRHGDEAATALLKHRTVAESLLGRFDAPAVRALNALSIRNGRRLAMLSKDGLVDRAGRAAELLGVIGRYGDRALEFLWRHKAVLAGGATLAAFLADPEPYLDGSFRLVGAAGGVAAAPMFATAEEAARCRADLSSLAAPRPPLPFAIAIAILPFRHPGVFLDVESRACSTP